LVNVAPDSLAASVTGQPAAILRMGRDEEDVVDEEDPIEGVEIPGEVVGSGVALDRCP